MRDKLYLYPLPELNYGRHVRALSHNYAKLLGNQLQEFDWSIIDRLADHLDKVRIERRQLFICGNGGSAGNSIHLANDFLYGVSLNGKPGFRVESLAANNSVITCLANDVGYEEIFSYQIRIKAKPGDVLIALSGSGNSKNIVNAIETANSLDMETVAILGYSGGRCLNVAKTAIHFPVDDMQVAEDLQLIVGHMCMQRLCCEG